MDAQLVTPFSVPDTRAPNNEGLPQSQPRPLHLQPTLPKASQTPPAPRDPSQPLPPPIFIPNGIGVYSYALVCQVAKDDSVKIVHAQNDWTTRGTGQWK